MDDKRLIEDYLPIEAISFESAREKSTRKGHISTLHLWWARRPLVASRAAVYGALVPASQFIPNGAQTNEKKKSLGRANAAKFVKGLCQYPSSPHLISEAQHHILKAHAERLTHEVADWKAGKDDKPAWVDEFKFAGERVSAEDITGGRAPRPRVMDIFAGGGAIPLEASRLGCQVYALELNPVAHIIEVCTLVYPQKYGKSDPGARGMTGPKNARAGTTWGGLAEEVRYWGEWVLRKVKGEIGDLYPLIPDPQFKGKRAHIQSDWLKEHDEVPAGYVMPVAYLWTRTVQCKNPKCKATVPLVRQTWLSKKSGRFTAMKMTAPSDSKQVTFDIIEATSQAKLGFDPEEFSKGGNATCPFCGTVADIDYVKSEGSAARLGMQLMSVVCTRPGERGKVYVNARDAASAETDATHLTQRLGAIVKEHLLTPPDEPLPKPGTLGFRVQPYGIKTWGDLFSIRQKVALLTFARFTREAAKELESRGVSSQHATAIVTYLGLAIDRVAMFGNTLCAWYYQEQAVSGMFSRHAVPMLWDFAEVSLHANISGGITAGIERISDCIAAVQDTEPVEHLTRGAAQELPSKFRDVDAVVTDPPYYDNIPYADLSDFFYVWLKRTIGHLYPEHFASVTTPKRSEAVAEPMRFGGDKAAARKGYEEMMSASFMQASRALKPRGFLVVVYAHKTTLGWSTLVDALRRAEFVVIEAWPVDTEGPGRLRAHDSAALASSIFLVARKREAGQMGSYEEQVRPELEGIVRERVETLWAMGISGADLVIACVGAGLRAFTRFARVEYANGEEVPAERFLTEVEGVVLDTILEKLSKEARQKSAVTDRRYSLAGLDAATRFYVLWRYTYGAADLDAGEAIIFANGTHVELDGHLGLSTGSRALVEKKKGKYKLRDFAERGDDDDLGLPGEDAGEPQQAIDVLHRLLWLLEKRPALIADFIADANPSIDQLRLVAQALAGPALKGGEMENVSPTAEQSALGKLLANWSNIIEGKTIIQDRRVGQQQLRLR